MNKKYISKTCLSLNVPLSTGKAVHISFLPLTGGGSAYYTSNELIQEGLSKHHGYGRSFKEVEEEEVDKTEVSTDETAIDTVEETGIKVQSLDEAKDYLCDRYGYSRTKLKGVAGVKAAAAKSGISFIGI